MLNTRGKQRPRCSSIHLEHACPIVSACTAPQHLLAATSQHFARTLPEPHKSACCCLVMANRLVGASGHQPAPPPIHTHPCLHVWLHICKHLCMKDPKLHCRGVMQGVTMHKGTQALHIHRPAFSSKGPALLLCQGNSPFTAVCLFINPFLQLLHACFSIHPHTGQQEAQRLMRQLEACAENVQAVGARALKELAEEWEQYRSSFNQLAGVYQVSA